MEIYLLGSLLGLGYYLNSNEEEKKKKLNYPKKMYRGNIYDNEQYDKVENEIFDKAKIKFDKAQNLYENNVVGKYTPDVLYNKESEHKFSRGVEGFLGNMEEEGEFGNSVRKDFCYVDENGNKYPCSERDLNKNKHSYNIKNRYDFENKTVKADNALAKVSNNEIKSWNDDGGIDPHTELDEQFDLLGQGGQQGVKQTYDEPWHNNMVPFFGGSIKQNVDPLANESKLSMFTGQWDYSRKQKQEIAPMFAPEKNIKNVYGDNQFLEKVNQNIDRFIPSLMRTNEAPTEKVYVAPGLNIGYMENPDFGFHDPVRVLPKTTNEIRAKNKPKLTYDKPVLSGKSITQEGTKRLNVNKNLPELVVYNEKGEHTFGAKSVVAGETGRPTYLLGRALRSFSKYLFGNAKDTSAAATQSRSAYKDNNKKNLFDLKNRQGPAVAITKRTNVGLSDKAKDTSRKTNVEKNTHQGYFASIYTAVTNYLAPAKKTVKETTLSSTKPMNIKTDRKVGILVNPDSKAKNTIRQTTEKNYHSGNLGSTRKAGKVLNTDEKAKTTIRETTELNKYEGNLKTTRKVGKVHNPDEKAKTTVRETTELNNHEGNLKTTRKVGKVHNPDEEAKTTVRETTELNNHEGNLKTTRKVGKVHNPDEKAKTTIRETTELNNHEANLTTTRKVGKAYDPDQKAKNTVRQTTEVNSHNGNMGNLEKKQKVYDPEDKPEYTLKDIVKVSDYKGILGNTEKKLKVHDPDDKARYTTRQDALVKNYVGGKGAGQNNGAYEVIDVEAKYTSRQDALIENYKGTAGAEVAAQQDYEAAYNAETNALKELIAKGRAPTQNSVKVAAGVDKQNVEIKRIDSDSKNPRGMESDLPNVDKLYVMPPTANEISLTKDKLTVYQRQNVDRMEPAILDAFRNNPYTQSLHSYVFP